MHKKEVLAIIYKIQSMKSMNASLKLERGGERKGCIFFLSSICFI